MVTLIIHVAVWIEFLVMFHDNSIAESFELRPNKVRYITHWGFAPYFKEIVKNNLMKTPEVAIGFDESLNPVTQIFQIDLNVIYLNIETDWVKFC